MWEFAGWVLADEMTLALALKLRRYLLRSNLAQGLLRDAGDAVFSEVGAGAKGFEFFEACGAPLR